MNPLLILYGQPGAGKSFIGNWLATHHAFYFYDADIHLSDAMKQRLKEKRCFTQSMRDQFFARVISYINQYLSHYPRVAVAQALSQTINRQQLQHAFPMAKFICIETDYETQKKRLEQRNDWVTPEWLDILRSIQAPPNPDHMILNNSSDAESIFLQIEACLTVFETHI